MASMSRVEAKFSSSLDVRSGGGLVGGGCCCCDGGGGPLSFAPVDPSGSKGHSWPPRMTWPGMEPGTPEAGGSRDPPPLEVEAIPQSSSVSCPPETSLDTLIAGRPQQMRQAPARGSQKH